MSPPARTSTLAPPPCLLLVGNPNVGKSVLFGLLSGRYVEVSNYPGTTVEISAARRRDGPGEIIDTPGTNSLLPASEEERVTRDLLLQRLAAHEGHVLQICDAKNLSRGLRLTLELAELGAPVALALNMMDEARSRGITTDVPRLEELLAVPVFPAVATRRQGTAPLMSVDLHHRVPQARVDYGEVLEGYIRQVSDLLPETVPGVRGVALMLLAGDSTLDAWTASTLGPELELIGQLRREAARQLHEPLRQVIDRARSAAAERLVRHVQERSPPQVEGSWLGRLGDLCMHPLWGLPIAAVLMVLLYYLVGKLGAGVIVDFLESSVFEALLVPAADWLLRLVTPLWLETPLVGPPGTELGAGPGLLIGEFGLLSMGLTYAVAIVLPIVSCFFLAFSLMEDSGYLPRLAVMLNRVFKALSLNGKAVLPMVLGLGCVTMAIMTTRILPTRRERLLTTLLLALAVPCSAQLGIILGMMAALSPWALVSWLGVMVGVMLLVGYLAGRLLPGEEADFIMEVPPMRRPQLRNVLRKTLSRVVWYLREAVPLFLLGTLVLWFLDLLGLLNLLRRAASPVVVSWLGLPERATEAFLLGFFRRDYGAAGLFDLFQEQLGASAVSLQTEIQVVVAMVTMTLFVPCVATLFMMVKEQGWRIALALTGFIFCLAILVGGGLNLVLRLALPV